MTQTPRLLVTGGAGFIGSYVNKLLLQKGYFTTVLDNLSNGMAQERELVITDLGDSDSLKKIFDKGIDAVLHFAAFIDVGESVKNPFKYYQNNVAKSLVLLEEMKKAGVNKFIFSSSAAVYGNPLTASLAEDHSKHPVNPYGKTKLMLEEMIEDASNAYGLNAISLRYFNAAGGDKEGKLLYRNPHPTNLIPILLNAVKAKKPFTLFGDDYPTNDGTCVRDYIHIHDLASAHLLALEALFNGHKTDVYNLGNGQGFSVLEVIQAVEKVTGEKVQIIKGKRREGDPAFLLANAAKIKRELGWTPLYPSLEEIVEDARKVSFNSASLRD